MAFPHPVHDEKITRRIERYLARLAKAVFRYGQSALATVANALRSVDSADGRVCLADNQVHVTARLTDVDDTQNAIVALIRDPGDVVRRVHCDAVCVERSEPALTHRYGARIWNAGACADFKPPTVRHAVMKGPCVAYKSCRGLSCARPVKSRWCEMSGAAGNRRRDCASNAVSRPIAEQVIVPEHDAKPVRDHQLLVVDEDDEAGIRQSARADLIAPGIAAPKHCIRRAGNLIRTRQRDRSRKAAIAGPFRSAA